MVTRINHFFSCVLAIAAIFCLASRAEAATVRSELANDQTPAGEGVKYSIIIEGGSPQEDPVMPEVKDLSFEFTGRAQQFTFGNGGSNSSVSYNFIVGSAVAGVYQIPAIELVVGGQKISAQAQRLTVLPNGQAPAPVNPEELKKLENDPQRFGFLTVEMANQKRKHAYLGELAPVRIRAWLPIESRAQLRSGIQPESKAFTLQNVSNQPEQTRETRDGKQYLVVTWFGGISATKEGFYPASLSLKATVAVPDVSKRVLRQQRVPMVEKEVTLTSEDQEIEVRALPKEGRPTDFTGAVGAFQFDAMEIPAQWNVGEPQKVAVRIAGSGNFSTLKAPAVSPADLWKMYPGQDQFSPGDHASFAGTKVFQFDAIPKRNGRYDAHFHMSFFDPDLEKYQVIDSQPQSVQIDGENKSESEDDSVATTPAPPSPPADDEPLALKSKPTPTRSLRPWSSSMSFFLLVIAAAIVACSGPAFLLWRTVYRNPQRLERLRIRTAVQTEMARAQRCAQAGDVVGFLEAGRSALQQKLAADWKLAPQAITLADVQARLTNDAPVLQFFREVDRAAYGGSSSATALASYQALLQQSLTQLSS